MGIVQIIDCQSCGQWIRLDHCQVDQLLYALVSDSTVYCIGTGVTKARSGMPESKKWYCECSRVQEVNATCWIFELMNPMMVEKVGQISLVLPFIALHSLYSTIS